MVGKHLERQHMVRVELVRKHLVGLELERQHVEWQQLVGVELVGKQLVRLDLEWKHLVERLVDGGHLGLGAPCARRGRPSRRR